MKRITTILAAAMLGACSMERGVSVELSKPEAEATFVVSATPANASTRAIDQGGEADNAVDEVTILLFDAATGKYVSFVRSTSPEKIAGHSNLWKVVVEIPDGDYNAIFIANAAAQISAAALTTQTTIDEAEFKIYRVIGSKYNSMPGSAGYVPFVMSSGRVAFTSPAAPADKYPREPVKLLRDVAKINVRFDNAGASAALTIDEIRLVNYNMVSMAVPDPDLWLNRDLSPNIFFDPAMARPAAVIINGHDEYTSIVYRRTAGEITSEGCIDQIFTPERPLSDADNMYLLVKGDVTIGGVTRLDRWFKLSMLRRDVSGELKDVNVLRNHVYTFNITAVSDWGHAAIDEAADAPASNLIVELITEQDGLNDVVYNGKNYLAVTRTEYEFSCIAELEQALDIHTDDPDGWTIATPTGGWPEWVSASPTLSGGGGTTAQSSIGLDANIDNNERSFTFNIDAGPLRQTITVRQKPNRYVFAAPGVVGIRLSDYRDLMRARIQAANPAWLDPNIKLSLRGSSTYKGTIVDTPAALADFGGALETEPVYSIYTMFGSMVAVLMGAGEAWAEDGRRVVWANPEYTGLTTGPWEGGSLIPAQTKSYLSDYDIADDPSKGHGDICKSVSGGSFRTPRGYPWQPDDGTRPFGGTGYLIGPNWWTQAASPATFWTKGAPNAPYIGVDDQAIMADKGQTIFLPAAGYIETDGIASRVGSSVQYHTSTAVDGQNGTQMASTLSAESDILAPHSLARMINGLPVRCVKDIPDVTPPPYPDVDPALLAPPGVLGVSESGELTLRGSREYEGTDIARNAGFGPVHEETVYIVFYKFGSNVAIPASGTVSAWNQIQPSFTNGWPNDPCPSATVNRQGGKGTGYHVPSISNGYWNSMAGLTVGSVPLKNGKTVQGRYDNPGWTMFLPFAGSRGPNGAKIFTNYWSSTMHDANGARYLRITANSNPSAWSVILVNSVIAAPVRCVK